MKEIKIKGRITPLTPKGSTRHIESDIAPKEFLVLIDMYKQGNDYAKLGFIINGRRCMVYGRYIMGYDEVRYYFYATPVDEPKERTKLRVTEQLADTVFMVFCKNNTDWKQLLASWERTTSKYFRKRIINHLYSITKDRDCNSCPIRFQCFTEK